MTPKELGQYVNNLIANAETEGAIKQLLKYFGGKPQYRTFRSQVLYIQSQYQKNKKDQDKGLISFDNAQLAHNQITNQLLSIAAQLETGELEQEVKQKRQNRRLGLLIGLPAFVAVAWGLYLFSLQKGIIGVDEYACPVYEDQDKFNILVLPFQPIGNQVKKVSNTHRSIINRLEVLSEQNSLPTEQLSLQRNTFALSEGRYPNTASEAAQIGKQCDSDLIIWGTTEEDPNGGELTVRRQFKFLGQGEMFALDRIMQVDGDTVETVRRQTNIATGNQITGRVEELLLGIFAYYQGENRKAEELLTQVIRDTVDLDAEAMDDTKLLTGVFLANAQVNAGHTEEALETYDEVLKDHPEYNLGRNNRGMLNFLKGDYMTATQDFSVVLEMSENDTSALIKRAQAYQKQEMLKEAEADYRAAQKLDNKNPKVNQGLSEIKRDLQSAVKAEKTSRIESERNPSNTEAWKARAVSNFQIGEYANAEKYARRVLAADREDEEANKWYLKSLYAQDKQKEALEFLQKPSVIDRVELKKVVPRGVLKDLSQSKRNTKEKN